MLLVSSAIAFTLLINLQNVPLSFNQNRPGTIPVIVHVKTKKGEEDDWSVIHE